MVYIILVEINNNERGGGGLMTLSEMQHAHKAWVDKNFPTRQPFYFVLGAQEEIGEFSGAVLKSYEGIRGTKAEHASKQQDAIADTIFFLMGYASDQGWDLMSLLEQTWSEISQRDWVSCPRNGRDA